FPSCSGVARSRPVSTTAPTSGPIAGGTSITITGTGFSTSPGATTVTFGANAGTAVSCSTTTSCAATSPAHAAATVDVRVTVASQTSATGAADQFTYPAPATTVSSTPPTSRPAG